MSFQPYDTFAARPSEYSLPCNEDVPKEFRDRMHPWIEGFVGLEPPQAQERLAERWTGIQTQEFARLRDTLLKFSAVAIVDFEEGGTLAGKRPESSGDKIGDWWYLPAPLSRDYIVERLKGIGFDPSDAMVEFFDHFGGLAENTVESGSFRYSEDFWPLFGVEDTARGMWGRDWPESVQSFQDWHGSLMWYQALNGCYLLLRADEAVGWWIMQEQRVEPIAQSIEEFAVQYADHWKVAWPYDPYGK